jgi:hypothetical protein
METVAFELVRPRENFFLLVQLLHFLQQMDEQQHYCQNSDLVYTVYTNSSQKLTVWQAPARDRLFPL